MSAGALAGLALSAVLLARAENGPEAAPMAAEPESTAAALRALPPEVMRSAIHFLQEEVNRGAFPGAALAIGLGAEISAVAGVGAIGWTAAALPVDPARTLYDLASVTKIVATTSAVMLLLEDGELSLDDPVSLHLPAFNGAGKERVTLRHLLTHTSGLPAGMRIRGATRAERIRHVLEKSSLYASPGTAAAYSDLNFIVLYEAARQAAHEPLPEYLERRLFRPLGMTETRFSPGLECEACAPTGRLKDQRLYRGKPFDLIGQQLDGITGSSGLFSTAGDLARFVAMVAGEGRLDGVRVLRPGTIREFLSPQALPGRRLLGWDVLCAEGAKPTREQCQKVTAVGHTGFTGTSLWIDPGTGAWAVLLANRTYEPKTRVDMDEIRRRILELALSGVGGAADPTEPADWVNAR